MYASETWALSQSDMFRHVERKAMMICRTIKEEETQY